MFPFFAVLAILRLSDIVLALFAEYLRYVLCTDDYCVCRSLEERSGSMVECSTSDREVAS